ncbi:LytR/AlgR family response regulator transcription factor [Dinghuibacter silviterrae]|uniref:LytTR family two component transcriptional regulator n=1 Tax=Dinghuibacter silviterrae TaxID=1539049 RepID=A0A4V3GKL0_9BACT|nr:LytTR family DNA-binding domain-containing protein [Dinghuibacter silviterrae]TDW96072.1 LytTR family two component transcriptional regulator [Dinghuibacter silviterrae]
MTLNCIIVDDEPIARDLLKTYVSQVPYLHLTAVCTDAFEAMDALKGGEVDLIILDINMPRLTGFDMLRSLKKYPAVIITSAYPEYALEGFELSVTDYLLKPFSFARFVQATGKVAAPGPAPTVEAPAFLVVKADKKLVKVPLDDILYVEAYGNYIFVHQKSGRLMSKQTLTQFEEQLPADRFTRIHKSYIVALQAIQYVEGNEVTLAGKRLPVGKVYRENLMHRFR